MNVNPITLADSYKYTQPRQYPEGLSGMYDYAEARSDKVYAETCFTGLQYLIKEYLTIKITMEHVEKAKLQAEAHGIPFEYEAWSYIAKELDGKLPIKIRALPEGTVIPVKNVLFTVEYTDKNVPWITSWVETLLMKTWYSSNVSTRSLYVKRMLMKYATKTMDVPFVDFQFLNFGDRGSSSVEAAVVAGMSHLFLFKGTDNFNTIGVMDDYYESPLNAIGYSIDASEHSSTSSWSRDNEMDMLMNHLENTKGKPLVAGVIDTYDVFKCTNELTSGEFKEKIESDAYPTFVMRPDSGNAPDVIEEMLNIMTKNKVKYTVNSKGYKIFNKYRILWGDGINESTIESILIKVIELGYSSENMVFGSGGWLSAQHDRDTQGWAIKCSNISLDIDNEQIEREVFKDPITDPGKKSKKGKVTTFYNPSTQTYFVDLIDSDFDNGSYDALTTIYENGKMTKSYSLEEVRINSNMRL